MKKGIVLLIIIVIFISCKKDNTANDLKNEISGTWELEKRTCGICPNPTINYPPGNKNLIIINTDGSFQRKSNDTLVFNGSYSIERNKVCNSSLGDMALMVNEGPYPTPQFIQIHDNKLILGTPYCYQDGASTTYRRIM